MEILSLQVRHSEYPGSDGYDPEVVALYEEIAPTLIPGEPTVETVQRLHAQRRLTDNKAIELSQIIDQHRRANHWV